LSYISKKKKEQKDKTTKSALYTAFEHILKGLVNTYQFPVVVMQASIKKCKKKAFAFHLQNIIFMKNENTNALGKHEMQTK
jgi:hypothetical protein